LRKAGNMAYEMSFLKALLLTVGIETIVLFILFKLVFKSPDIKYWLLILTGILTSFSTLPYLWFILPLFIKERLSYTVISEVTAILIESVIVYGILKISYKKSLMASVTCNMASFLTGLFIHWP
jgi:hypothetical protein